METYHKIQTLFKRDLDGTITGKKGKMIEGQWTTPDLEYLAGNEWEFTEKVDGMNVRINADLNLDFDKHIRFGGRTDNAVVPKPLLEHLDNTFSWEGFIKAGLEGNVTLFGEGYGPKIQSGGKYRDDHSFVLFDVKIGDFWLDRDNVNDIASKLGIDSVPVLGYGTLSDGIAVVKGDTRRRVELWDEDEEVYQKRYIPGPLKSEWGDFEAEGIVARPKVPLFNRKGERIITKIKAVDFR